MGAVQSRFKSPTQESLDHQSQLVALVGPVFIELAIALVVPSKTSNLRLAEIELAAVVQILAISCEVVDKAQSPAHEVHHVLRVLVRDAVPRERMGNPLSSDEPRIGHSVLVTQDSADHRSGVPLSSQAHNQLLNVRLVGGRPSGSLADAGLAGTAAALASTMHA